MCTLEVESEAERRICTCFARRWRTHHARGWDIVMMGWGYFQLHTYGSLASGISDKDARHLRRIDRISKDHFWRTFGNGEHEILLVRFRNASEKEDWGVEVKG
jgi:hypothetical protein